MFRILAGFETVVSGARNSGKGGKRTFGNKDLNEDQVNVIQSKLSDLESQFSSLLSLKRTTSVSSS